MRGTLPSARTFLTAATCWLLIVVCSAAATSQSTARRNAGARAELNRPEQKTAMYFESIRKSPPQQLAFLLKMPKGADLHNHLSGSIYAESYVEWAAENGLCVNNSTLALSVPAFKGICDPKLDQSPASSALTNSVLYRRMIDAWSMRNWQLSGQSGHDHFFDSFGRFGAATYNQGGRMLADAVSRAARGHVSYLELMLTPDGTPTGVRKCEKAREWNRLCVQTSIENGMY